MQISNEAVMYIMFQRTSYSRLTNSSIYRVFNKIVPFSFYNQLVKYEAKTNSSRIKALYKNDMRLEYLSIVKFLPKSCSTILDIGCGLAGIDIFLHRHYQDNSPVFYLLDKTYTEKNVYYGFKSKGAFYNSLKIAQKMLINNGLSLQNIQTLEANENNEINIDGKIDLIISLISWGFHYPVSIYLNRVYNILNNGGSIILDMRKGTDGIEILKNKFTKIEIIMEKSSYQRVLVSK